MNTPQDTEKICFSKNSDGICATSSKSNLFGSGFYSHG